VKYFHLNKIPIENYNVIGFDMDGTLYSERMFITQIYIKISQYLALYSYRKPSGIYDWMINRWNYKGSSYPFIFSEAIERFCILNDKKIIEGCLHIYRNTPFKIDLHQNIIDLLDQFSGKKEVFLVSDGHFELQKRKFTSLRLNRWFLNENVVFTGRWGSNYYKPNVESIKYVSCLRDRDESVLYFGDRDMDEQFAKNAGFDFVKVEKFNEFWEVN